MTAEIAIMNKEAVALAADSAATMTREKIFGSANKLFALSKYQPVGIMVYGDASIMHVPWEPVIKIYRNALSGKKFNSLEEYANDFIEFLDNGNPMFPDSVQQRYLHQSINSYFRFIKDMVTTEVHSTIVKTSKAPDDKEVERIVSDVIKKVYESWEKADTIPSISETYSNDIIDEYGEAIDKAVEECFEQLPLSETQSVQLRIIAASLFSKFPTSFGRKDIPAVVIAGFGETDIFPSLRAFDVEGVVKNKLKYKEQKTRKVGFDAAAFIVAFAQKEMVATFMEGIDPEIRNEQNRQLSQVLLNKYPEIIVESIEGLDDKGKRALMARLEDAGQRVFEDYQAVMQTYITNNYVEPITRVVAGLPKDELAEMAESLVNITCFKRKVSMESETVGGPIDVAVISKGDGFVWIKRKHYFEPELNPQFFANYYKEA